MQQIATLEKDSLLALALASGRTITQVADEANIERSTVHRKLDNPDFRRQVAEFRDRLIGTALGRMADGMTHAVDKLHLLLEDESPSIRLRAIRTMISLGMRLRDSVDLTTRIHAVETHLDAKLGAQP